MTSVATGRRRPTRRTRPWLRAWAGRPSPWASLSRSCRETTRELATGAIAEGASGAGAIAEGASSAGAIAEGASSAGASAEDASSAGGPGGVRRSQGGQVECAETRGSLAVTFYSGIREKGQEWRWVHCQPGAEVLCNQGQPGLYPGSLIWEICVAVLQAT
eukprot:365357-Chlamydomonas_euryale.AAC.6